MYTVGLDIKIDLITLIFCISMFAICTIKIIMSLNPSSTGVRGHSTAVSNHPSLLNPFFVTGFTDAEGSFILSINRSSRYKSG